MKKMICFGLPVKKMICFGLPVKKIICFGLSLSVCVLLTTCSTDKTPVNSPVGVCMHLQDGGEHTLIPANLRLVRDAGIRWIRADFAWSTVEGPQGNWHYDHLDRVVEETEKLGISLMPLLAFNVSWANPAYKHMDAWLTYVEKTVTRYKDKIHVWEVWNEPNLYPRFWDQPDDGENYALLLKATYRKVKEIDPNAIVVSAGTAGIPMRYIEKAFAAGAGEGFDKMGIHPYRSFLHNWEETIRFKDDLDALRALMTKYNIGDKGIYFTEMGTSSMASVATRGKNVFHEIKAETGKDWTVAVICDDDFPVDPSFTAQTLRSFFPSGFRLDTVQLFDFGKINRNKYDAVFFPPSDNIPLHISQTITPTLERYMKGGGKVYYHTKNGNTYYYGDAATKETNQAVYIAQTMCLALRFGIEKYFLYEFQSPGEIFFDREDNFGLTNPDLSPKQAYHAYATIGELFPENSEMDTATEWRQKDCCVVSWKQPNGTRVWAVWSPEGERKVNVKIGKGLKQTLNCVGKDLPGVTESSTTLETGAGVTYLVGPETFVIQ